MRGTTQTIYSLIFRAQALLGLVLVAWLITGVLVAGQYAGTSMIVGVIAGVIGLACLLPYLTPGWLGRPTRRGQLIPLVCAHIALPLMYSFVAISAVLSIDVGADVNRQLVLGAFSLLAATGLINLIVGAKLCFQPTNASHANEGGTVTELVLPRVAARSAQSDDDADAPRRLSRAS